LLTTELINLQGKLRDVKLDKTIEERDIKHLIKCEREKTALELKKYRVELEAEYQQKEMELQKSYHEKVLQTLREGQGKMEEVHKQILAALPNVDVALSNVFKKDD
jgi:hypothetical protein